MEILAMIYIGIAFAVAATVANGQGTLPATLFAIVVGLSWPIWLGYLILRWIRK